MSGGIVDYLKLLKCPIEDNKAHNCLPSLDNQHVLISILPSGLLIWLGVK